MERTCKKCGGGSGIHHYKTLQCPVGGREAHDVRKQEWCDTIFEADDGLAGLIHDLTHEVKELKEMVRELEQERKAQ